jgi:hypothetical protein
MQDIVVYIVFERVLKPVSAILFYNAETNSSAWFLLMVMLIVSSIT